jgi:hypothetical protein
VSCSNIINIPISIYNNSISILVFYLVVIFFGALGREEHWFFYVFISLFDFKTVLNWKDLTFLGKRCFASRPG